MWKSNDDFWLTLPKNKDESALLVALGIQLLRITASVDDDSETSATRDGHIDVKILSFDRKSGEMSATVVENTTELRFSSQTLIMKVDENAGPDICYIKEIDGIIF